MNLKKKIIIFIILFVCLIVFSNIRSENTISKIKINFQKIKENIFDSNRFIINGFVTQYSAVLSLKKNRYQIETLNFIENFSSKSIRCLAWFNNTLYIIPTSNILPIELMKTKYNINFFYKIKCNFETNRQNFSDIFVTLIDLRYFNDILNQINYIQFHKPVFFDVNKLKKKSIVNCVHTVNNLDDIKRKKLINWIQFQQEIVYEKIVIYFLNETDDFKNFLNKKFGTFVQIIDHQTSLSQVCGWHQKLAAINPNNLFAQSILANCQRSFTVNFYLNDRYIKNSHERLCSNDCLMKSKFEFEYLTNYDFDEIIFPRVHNTKWLTEISTKKKCTNKDKSKKVSMYHYIKRLESIYGNNIASFLFENVNMLTEHSVIKKRIVEFDRLENLKYNINNLNIELTVVNGIDKNYLNSYRKNKQHFECMNSTILLNKNLDPKWNNYFGLLVNYRYGKSIYNTDLTLSFNQHYSFKNKFNSFNVKVSIYHGFVSHFRDKELSWNQTYSVQNLIIDLEYYEFLSQNFKNF